MWISITSYTILNNSKTTVHKKMTNLNNSVDIQGMGNTIDLQTVMNDFTSSYTENYIKVLNNYNSKLQESIKVVDEVKQIKPPTKRKPKSKTKNKGFEKLKNTLLREKLEDCESVVFNPKKHIHFKDLGYKSIHILSTRSQSLWKQYFSKNNIFLEKGVTSSKISKSILFDKSIVELFGKKDTSNITTKNLENKSNQQEQSQTKNN